MRRKTAFTLIELLIVISIIGALAAITYPLLSISSSRTYERQCDSRLQQIGLALNAYAQDNGCFPETLSKIDRFLQDKELLRCPRTSRMYHYQRPSPGADKDTVIVTCVDPECPAGKLPHRSGSAYLALTTGGRVQVARK